MQTRSRRPSPLAWRYRLLAILAVFALCAVPASAQQVSIIRDAEVESLVRNFAMPLFKAAGMGRRPPDIYLVNDRRFNAFVTENGSIFVNSGTIIDSQTPGELKGVLAHEIGHLAGGHLARLREQADVHAKIQVLSVLLGAGALMASGGGDSAELRGLATAFIFASQSAGTNSFMAYRRSEESAADAAAIKLLDASGQSARGLVTVLRTLEENQVRQAGASPYLRTHPLAKDRLDQVTAAARAARNWPRPDPATEIRALELAKAKLSGFMQSRQTVIDRYPNSDKSLAARYARIIAVYKAGSAVSALTQMPSLVAKARKNPYFHELFGQMLLESGKAEQSLAPLEKAVKLAPGETQIRIMYGLALIQTGGRANLEEAVAQLSRAVREDRRSVRGLTFLARAHKGLGQKGDAQLAAAEAAFGRGDPGTAKGLARQALKHLIEGSPAWLRANDILALD